MNYRSEANKRAYNEKTKWENFLEDDDAFFTNKRIRKESINLVANWETPSSTQKISEILNTFFSDVVK